MLKTFDCMFGTTGVTGTDFDDDDNTPAGWTNGSTGWLRTKAPVDPGKTFTIRFVTYDSSDHNVVSFMGTAMTYDTVYPNGKDCAPACRHIDFDQHTS